MGDLVARLLKHRRELVAPTQNIPNYPGFVKENELVLEVEELIYGSSCKALLISTGTMAKVSPREVVA